MSTGKEMNRTTQEVWMMMNENVVKILKAYMWDVATCSDDGNPNVVPVAFKNVTEDGKLVVGDVFMETTMNNVKANGKVACVHPTSKSGRHPEPTEKLRLQDGHPSRTSLAKGCQSHTLKHFNRSFCKSSSLERPFCK